MRLSVLDDIERRVSSIEGINTQSLEPVKDGDVVLGTVDDEYLRRLISVKKLLIVEHMDYTHQAVKAELLGNTPDDENLRQRVYLSLLVELVDKLFWTEVRVRLQVETVPSLALRSDWHIVKPGDTSPDIENLLQHLNLGSDD